MCIMYDKQTFAQMLNFAYFLAMVCIYMYTLILDN